MTEFEVVENLLGQHVCTGWPFWCQKRQSTKIMMKKNRLLETENCFMTGETYGSSAVTRTPNRRPRLWEIFFRVKAGKSHFYLFSPIILIHFCETLTPTRKIGTEARGESSPNLDSHILFRKLQNFLVFFWDYSESKEHLHQNQQTPFSRSWAQNQELPASNAVVDQKQDEEGCMATISIDLTLSQKWP